MAINLKSSILFSILRILRLKDVIITGFREKKSSALEKRVIHSIWTNLCLGILLLFVSTNESFAVTITHDEFNSLLNQIRQLKNEVNQLKKDVKNKSVHSAKKYPHKQQHIRSNTQVKKERPQTHSIKEKDSFNNSLTLGGLPIVFNPYTGQPHAYSGSDLLTNLAQQNGDLLVLQYRQELANTFPDNSTYLIFSGSLGGQIFSTKTYIGTKTSDIDLTYANITALAGIGSWVSGFFSFDYDNIAPSSLSPAQIGPRFLNSRVYLDQAFLSIGNLNKSDWYISLGQMYLPFGAYNGYMINSPLTSSLFTTIERPLLLGYSHSSNHTELDIEAYGFQGDTITFNNQSEINEWGASLDFLINMSQWNSDFGLGYISNIADAEGFQLNGQNLISCKVFSGFAFPCNTGNLLVHKVPGFDVHASLTVDAYSLVVEYITATRHFAYADLAYNEHAAKPKSFDIEAAYTFSFWQKPSNIAFGYSFTKEALALLLPAQEYSFVFTTSLWRNTTESIGYQYDINYSKNSFASGQRLPIFFPIDRINLGKTSHTILFAINVSF